MRLREFPLESCGYLAKDSGLGLRGRARRGLPQVHQPSAAAIEEHTLTGLPLPGQHLNARPADRGNTADTNVRLRLVEEDVLPVVRPPWLVIELEASGQLSQVGPIAGDREDGHGALGAAEEDDARSVRREDREQELGPTFEQRPHWA